MKGDLGDVPDFVSNPRLGIAPDSAMARKAAPAAAKGKGAGKKRKVKPLQAGHDGRLEIGSRAVDDPYEAGAKLTARVNVAEHPLEWLAARKKIDLVQYNAGARFRALFERATIGSARGIDPGKVKVDGGGAGDPLDAGVAEAHQQIKLIKGLVDTVSMRLIMLIAGEGRTIAAVAETWPMRGVQAARAMYISERFREALSALAGVMGIEAEARGPGRGRVQGVTFERNAFIAKGLERAIASGACVGINRNEFDRRA